MQIYWYGESCFKLQSSDFTILIDPEAPKKAGLRGPNYKADIVLLSDPDSKDALKGKIAPESFCINEPGEYEVKNIFLEAFPYYDKNKISSVVYRLLFEDITFCFLGPINSVLPEEIVERIGEVDVLFVPVGDSGVLDADAADRLINEIEPKIIIPSNFYTEDLTIKRDKAEKILKKIGKKDIQSRDKLSINKRDFVGGDLLKEKAIVLEVKTL